MRVVITNLAFFILFSNEAATSAAADNPYSGQPIQPTEPACCSSKTVGGLLYSLTSQDDNSAFECLNTCRYAREDEEGENRYCFGAGTLEVECHDRGTEPVAGTKEPITEQPGTKDPVTAEQPAPGTNAPILSTFTISEGDEPIVQENSFRSDTGIMEWKVPAHKNYTKSVFMFHQGSNTAILKTGDTCQQSDLPGYINISDTTGELNKQRMNGDNEIQIVEKFVLKAREARFGSIKRKGLVQDVQDLCKNVSLVKTNDYEVNKTEFEKYNKGEIVFLKNRRSSRGCSQETACSKTGPGACGYGWINPAWVDKGFSFHQVSSGTVCVKCNLQKGLPLCPLGPLHKPPVNNPGKYCLCDNIVDKKTFFECSIDSETDSTVQLDGQMRITQTMTYNSATISLTISTPAHKDVGALDVIMHAKIDGILSLFPIFIPNPYIGYWHYDDLTNNRMFKLGDDCYIETLPADVFPVDIALGIQEIKNGNDVTTEDDEISKCAILHDDMQTEVAPLPLHPDIMRQCATFKKFVERPITEKQSNDLNEGKVILLDSKSSIRSCELSTATVNKNSGVWRYPNPGPTLFVHKTLHSVTSIPCCQNPDGSPTCCQDTYPQYCECKDLITAQDFKRCNPALFVATGLDWTGTLINSVEILMKGTNGMYTSRQVDIGGCSDAPDFPFTTSSATGAVFNDLVHICAGGGPSTQCFKFNTNAAWENDFNLKKPLAQWGSSAVFNNWAGVDTAWWIASGEPDGVGTEVWGGHPPAEISNSDIRLPFDMNQPCITRISEHEAFVTAIPKSISVTSNKAWIFNIQTNTWTPLPDTKKKRYGPACGVLQTSSGKFVVLAGGFQESTTEIFNLDTGIHGQWTTGPNIGVDLQGASMVSVRNEKALLLVGGYSGEPLPEIRRMDESMSSWKIVGNLATPRSGSVALAVTLGNLPPLC